MGKDNSESNENNMDSLSLSLLEITPYRNRNNLTTDGGDIDFYLDSNSREKIDKKKEDYPSFLNKLNSTEKGTSFGQLFLTVKRNTAKLISIFFQIP